jgi:pilus assembly protein CpaB
MGRLRGFLWFAAGLTVAILAGFVAFVTLSSAVAQDADQQEVSVPMVSVVVAAQAIEVRSLLTTEDLEAREVPVDAAPKGAVRDVEDAVGMITLVDLYPGEVILVQRLVDPNVASASGRLALVVAEEEVLMAFPAQDLMSQVGVLKPGDHVDLLFSLDLPTNRGILSLLASSEEEGQGVVGGGGGEGEEQFTFNLLQNLTIAALVRGGTATGGTDSGAPRAILLTVSPQDALVLKYVKDAGGILDIVLRAPGAEQPFDVEPVDVDYILNRYQIPTGIGW